MVERRWRQFAAVDPGRDYVVIASYLPLARFREIRKFLRYAREIGRQLEGAQGLIGFSLRAQLLRGRFWTLSAWNDEAALMMFVRAAPHGRIMATLKPHMGATTFVRWRVAGSALPPTWVEGLRRLGMA